MALVAVIFVGKSQPGMNEHVILVLVGPEIEKSPAILTDLNLQISIYICYDVRSQIRAALVSKDVIKFPHHPFHIGFELGPMMH